MRRPLVIYDFATAPFWILLYRRIFCILFYQYIRILNLSLRCFIFPLPPLILLTFVASFNLFPPFSSHSLISPSLFLLLLLLLYLICLLPSQTSLLSLSSALLACSCYLLFSLVPFEFLLLSFALIHEMK